jgi:ketosteroid isomerase-like protein
MRTPVEVVDAWNAAYDARDAEALVALAHEDVELVTPGRGTQRGHEAIRESVRRQTYGVGMHVGTHRRLHRDEPVVTAGTIELRFVDSGELAERFEAAAAFTVRDGRVARMEPHADLASALAAAGVDQADEVRAA